MVTVALCPECGKDIDLEAAEEQCPHCGAPLPEEFRPATQVALARRRRRRSGTSAFSMVTLLGRERGPWQGRRTTAGVLSIPPRVL